MTKPLILLLYFCLLLLMHKIYILCQSIHRYLLFLEKNFRSALLHALTLHFPQIYTKIHLKLKHIYNYFYQENLMSEKGLTTINLKKINRSKVYQYIYKTHQTSKMQIVQDLQMGLSTVSQNLNLLEKEGLIDRNGYFDSTGGRKAQAIQIVSDFRISIGIGILKNMFHITAIDLYGNAFYTETIALPYSNTEEYYRQLTDKVRKFIAENHYPNEKILGISIATQGITSPDNSTVIYGNIMNNTGMKLEDFSRHLPYPCHLEHDSKSAAFLELWNHPELDSAVVFLLNRNLGGAIITNHQIHQGSSSILTALYVTAETMAVWKPTALPTLWNSLPGCL